MYDDVTGRQRRREIVDIVSAVTAGSRTIRYMCNTNMPGTSFAFGQPILASNVHFIRRMVLSCGMCEDVSDRRNGREKADILSAVTWG